MSVNITDVLITPNPATVGQNFIISVTVFDDEFEFAETATVYDAHQGFADEAQTIGGKFTNAEVVEEYRGITTADSSRLKDANGNFVRQSSEQSYTSAYTGMEINAFIREVIE